MQYQCWEILNAVVFVSELIHYINSCARRSVVSMEVRTFTHGRHQLHFTAFKTRISNTQMFTGKIIALCQHSRPHSNQILHSLADDKKNIFPICIYCKAYKTDQNVNQNKERINRHGEKHAAL